TEISRAEHFPGQLPLQRLQQSPPEVGIRMPTRHEIGHYRRTRAAAAERLDEETCEGRTEESTLQLGRPHEFGKPFVAGLRGVARDVPAEQGLRSPCA